MANYSFFQNDEDQMLAVFSNTLSPLNWYNQPVDRDNGLLYGQEGTADHTARRNAS